MTSPCTAEFRSRLPGGVSEAPGEVPQLVDAILQAAQAAGASDVHLVPSAEALVMHWRIDGVLQPVDRLPRGIASNIAARLKVLADLLTYRTEVPQEGRIRRDEGAVEMRVSTFPTLYGEKVVVRLFVGSGEYRRLDHLGLPEDIAGPLRPLLTARGGLLLVTGPAGSGKTTTVYAALRELARADGATDAAVTGSGRSLVSIEDPIEAVIEGVAQSQVQPAAGFTYETGLRSLLRQDPDVILVGEIRDRVTAELVFQASLSGHLVLSTYHAGSAVGAMQRLADMGIEPYQIRSGLLAVLSQRLARRLCGCARESRDPVDRGGREAEAVWLPQGCAECRGTGYRGRLMLAEMRDRQGISAVDLADRRVVEETPGGALRDRGLEAVRRGWTSPAEFHRVFGPHSG